MTDAPRDLPTSPPDEISDDAATRVLSGASVAKAAPALPPEPQAPMPEPTVPRSASQLAPSVTAPAHGPIGVGDQGVLPAGSRMAEFEITHLIGQGGFGVVYEAWDHTLERTVAIKEYLPSALSTRGSDGTVTPLSEKHRETFELGMRSFINEARLLAQFDHPSLLKVYRFWEQHGTTYMVMPLYRGKTLRQTLAETPNVDEGWLLRIMDGVTQALAVMHNANCYHRDIAPDNILLLEGSGKPVVLDFGAARRVISDKTQAITVILKPGYAPVEQYAEMPDMAQGAWTDVYALAAVMHVAVCGRPPPPSVARIMSDTYVPLASNELLRQRYSQKLLETIDHGLAVRPEQRPQSMFALRVALELEESTTIAPLRAVSPRTVPGPQGVPPVTAGGEGTRANSAPGSLKTPAGSSKGRLLVAALVALAVLGAAVGWALRDSGQTPVATVTPPPVTASTEPVAPSGVPADALPSVATPAPAIRQTPLASLQALGDTATPDFSVQATPAKDLVQVGQDKLAFEVRSNREGYVYVYLLASGGEMFMLFPNLLDKHNKINANTTLALPRASWPMNAGGPPGENHFAVVVSQYEREFGESGLQSEGVFPKFSLSVLAALEAAHPEKATPLLGKPLCPSGDACTDAFGVANFKITER